MDEIIAKEIKNKYPELDKTIIKSIYKLIIEMQTEYKRASP